MTRPIASIIPVDRVRVAFPGLRAVSSSVLLTPGEETPREIEVKERRKGGIELTLPRLGAYGLLVLEGATLGRAT
jgi:hypothetical protein